MSCPQNISGCQGSTNSDDFICHPADTLPSHNEILEDLKKLVSLMEDPHPGLLTWLSARTELANVVYKKLKLVLGK